MLITLGVVVSFLLILVLIRKKFNFGLSLIVGSIVLGFFTLSETDVMDVLRVFVEATVYSFQERSINFETIELAVLLTLIYVLARAMQETGAINELIKSLKTIFYRGGTLGVIPAVYGLMPVPGGALFSAPLIDHEGDKFKLDRDQKNFLNIWFRHIWFPVFPVSSAMITICSEDFSNIDIYRLVLADTPSFILFIVIGWFFLRRYVKTDNRKHGDQPRREYRGLLYLIPPLTPVLFYLVLFIMGVPGLKDYQKIVFITGVLFSLIFLGLTVKTGWREYFTIMRRSLSFNLTVVIFGIMILREMILVSKANVALAGLISGLDISAVAIIILVPLLLGVITGYNLGAIALSYFLVEPFFGLTGLDIVGLTSIIFTSSLVGYLISPIHLCNVVSSDYLKTDVTGMYKVFIPSALMVLLFQVFIVRIVFS